MRQREYKIVELKMLHKSMTSETLTLPQLLLSPTIEQKPMVYSTQCIPTYIKSFQAHIYNDTFSIPNT